MPTDRRALIKERHRRAIVDAAAALMEETGGTDFTVSRLAERANVSRRTVFNHFDAVDDIVIAVGCELLSGIVDRFVLSVATAPEATADPESLFEEIADALRGAELVEPMAYLMRVLGGDDPAATPRSAVILLRTFTEVSERLAAEILERHAATDELTVDLLVGSLVSGLVVIHRHWVEATGAAVDAHSRRTWARLLERLIESTRRGYASV